MLSREERLLLQSITDRNGVDQPLEFSEGFAPTVTHFSALRTLGFIETGYGGVLVATPDGKQILREAANV